MFFFCLKQPGDGCGGETPLAKNSDILSRMDPEVIRKFEEKKLQYVRYLPDKSHREYLNWQYVFRTENKGILLEIMSISINLLAFYHAQML